MKLFFKITEIETLINIIYTVRSSSLNRCFCVFFINSFNDKTQCHGCSQFAKFITFIYAEEAGCDITGVVYFFR